MKELSESEYAAMKAVEDECENGFKNASPIRGKDGGGDQIMPGSPLHNAVIQIADFIDKPGIEAEVRKVLIAEDVPLEAVGWAINLAKKIKTKTVLDA